jgi:hypothetical protein
MADYVPNSAPWSAYNDGIKTAVVKSGVTVIGSYAFFACTSLTSVDLPESLTAIGREAFVWCSSLSSVTSHAASPPALDADVFRISSGRTLTVPAGSVEAYKASDWKQYFSTISAKTQ